MQALLVLVILYLADASPTQAYRARSPTSISSGPFCRPRRPCSLSWSAILQAGTYGWLRSTQDFVVGSTVLIPAGGISPLWLFELIGAVLLFLFFRHIASMERAGKEPLLATRMFQNRVSNLGLITQNIQWLVLLGLSFVISVYLQTARGYSAIETGLILTPATIGILRRVHGRRAVCGAACSGDADPSGLRRDDWRHASVAAAGARHHQRAGPWCLVSFWSASALA